MFHPDVSGVGTVGGLGNINDLQSWQIQCVLAIFSLKTRWWQEGGIHLFNFVQVLLISCFVKLSGTYQNVAH